MNANSLLMAARVAALGLLTTAGVAATPAHAITEYRGGGYISGFTNCEAHGWSGTERVLARLRPAGMAGNHPDTTRFSMILTAGTVIYHYSGLPSAEWNTVTAWGAFTVIHQYNILARFLPGSTTDFSGPPDRIFIHAEVNNFGDLEGCMATVYVLVNADPTRQL